MSSFIHFGCWNNLNSVSKNGKTKTVGCLNDVMKLLHQHINSNPVNFISIAGDNYYPDKITTDDNKTKIINVDLLKKGFQMLPLSNIFMIFGNHDLETRTVEQTNMIVQNGHNTMQEEINNCTIIDAEQTAARELPNIHFILFNEMWISKHTYTIMFDSSMFTEDSKDFFVCYNKFYDNKFHSIGELRDYQTQLIINSINQTGGIMKNFILIGHHPITGIKSKKGTNKQLNDIELFHDVLAKIGQMLGPDVNYYYLCADVHMYQSGTVVIDNDMTINQYIVGTGGTKLDDMPIADSSNEYVKKNLKYIHHESLQTCGFLRCDELDTGDLNFQFISTDQLNATTNKLPTNSSIGGKRSRRRKSRGHQTRVRKSKNTRRRKRRGLF